MSAFTRFLDWINSEVPSADALTGAEKVPLIQTSATKQSLLSTLADYVVQTATAFLQSGTGAIAETVQAMGRRVVWASQYGSGFTTTPGGDIAKAITALGADGGIVELPPGSVTLEAQVSIPSKITLRGRGIGVTNITAKASLNAHAFINSDASGGNSNIELLDFTYDGNYANQTTGNGVVITKGTYCYIEIETKNCHGTGQTFSGGSNNRAGPKNISRSNGLAGAGYGLYFFNSDDNQVEGGGIYDDNCIGVVIEASGASATAKRNKVGPVKARGNRADFSQSGAGVHWEDSAGGDANDGELVGPICTGGTGVGINNTGTNLHIMGGTVQGNTKAGVVSSAAVGFLYVGIKMLDNGAGDAGGYQTQMRFDDTGLNPASSGEVIGCKGSGTVEGLKTFSTFGAVKVIHCDFDGSTNDYNFASANDQLIVTDSVSADNGDAAASLTAGTSATTQRWATALTAARAVTLNTTGAAKGAKFHIVRSGGDTGGPWNLNVGTGPLKALVAGTWCEVKYNGSAWFLSAYGAL